MISHPTTHGPMSRIWYKVGPLPVINGLITPISRVITCYNSSYPFIFGQFIGVISNNSIDNDHRDNSTWYVSLFRLGDNDGTSTAKGKEEKLGECQVPTDFTGENQPTKTAGIWIVLEGSPVIHLGKIPHFDSYFSDGLKAPPR